MHNEPDHGDLDFPELLSTKSWTAFIFPTLLAAFIVLVFGSILWTLGARKMFAIFSIGIFVMYALKLFSLNSQKLCVDDGGVWLERGFLPWTKGLVGVKWRDLDMAAFGQGFFSWASGSHTVIVRHRFTKESELLIPHMDQGDRAATRINDLHEAFVHEGRFAGDPRS